MAVCENCLGLATDFYRLLSVAARATAQLEIDKQRRFVSSIAHAERQLEERLATAGFRLAPLIGRPFDPGLPARALNIDEFSGDEQLVVESVIEPAILSDRGVERHGVVTVKRA